MNLRLKLISSLLLLVFILPLSIQTIHAFDGHSHEVCMDFSTHMHETPMDCEIDNFQFNSFDYSVYEIDLSNTETRVAHLTQGYSYLTFHITFPSNQLRAPPAVI